MGLTSKWPSLLSTRIPSPVPTLGLTLGLKGYSAVLFRGRCRLPGLCPSAAIRLPFQATWENIEYKRIVLSIASYERNRYNPLHIHQHRSISRCTEHQPLPGWGSSVHFIGPKEKGVSNTHLLVPTFAPIFTLVSSHLDLNIGDCIITYYKRFYVEPI